MKTFKKIKWIVGISLVFFLIIMTNLTDSQNFEKIKDSVVTIYEDRLIAKSIVSDLSRLIHEKEMANAFADSTFFKEQNSQVNAQIDNLTSQFLTTKLTKEEQRVFENLQANIAKLQTIEDQEPLLLGNKDTPFSYYIFEVHENLADLADIQLKEGKRQLIISKDAVKKIEFFTRLENFMLIFMGVLVLAVVLYQPKIT